MKIKFSQICRDYLSLRGESPDLLPQLEEGEESAVLTLTDELRVRLMTKAEEATLELQRQEHDELRTTRIRPETDSAGTIIVRMPEDYLKLYSLRMADWKEAAIATEPEESLRNKLGADAPAWMTCRHNPMVREMRDSGGVFLQVFGSDSAGTEAELTYIPRPAFDGEYLTISRKAYLKILTD